MAHGRLYFAAGLGGFGTVLFVYFFWRNILDLLAYRIFPLIWKSSTVEDNGFTAFLTGLPLAIWLGLMLLPSLAVWTMDWLALDLGAERRGRVVGWMVVSQLIIVPISAVWLLVLVLSLYLISEALVGMLFIGVPTLLSMLSLKVALVATEMGHETPAPERPVAQ